ncbi:MAG: SusC/RagA family TonB-linked outer membrane protein [Bacteroidales bacterium]
MRNFISVLFLFFGCVLSIGLYAQGSHTVSGLVLDEAGEPLIGVNIIEKGTTTGTVTDLDGNYTINVSGPDAILVFSFVGYLSEEIPVNNQKEINLSLIPDLMSLDEVMVIGYGTVKKSNALGSISSVSSDDIDDLTVSSIDQALQGKAAGVQVINSSGAPGGKVTVRVRGMSTLNSGAEPLYVVDGVILGDNSFGKADGQAPDNKTGIGFLDPNSIESIEVLKDASATAIFGARGANGVVLITTTRGKAGVPKVSLNAYRGVQTLRKKYDILSPEQFREFWNIYNTNSRRPVYEDFEEGKELPARTDWQDEIINTGSIGDLITATPVENYNLTVSGGDENNTYLLSGGYFRQEGLLKKSGYEKYNIRIRGDHKVADWLEFGENLIVANSVRDRSSETGGIVRNMLIADPTAAPYDSTGNWTDLNKSGYGLNPVGLRDRREYIYESDRFFGNGYVSINIIPGLTFHSTVGLDVNLGDMEEFLPEYYINPADKRDLAIFRKRKERWNNFDFENTLTYTNTFGKHDLTAMVGYTYQKESFVDMRTTFTGFPYEEDFMRYPNVSNPLDVVTEMGSSPMEYIVSSVLSRVMYSYNEQLLLSGSIRRDGSSKFGPNTRYGYYPGVSAGYVLSKIPAIQNIKSISFLKIRAGWGILGNQSIPAYRYSTQIGFGNNYNFGSDEATYVGALPDGISNPDIRWERQTQENVALEAGFFQNKLNMTIDLFRKTTDDLLMQDLLPAFVGVHSLERVSDVTPTGKLPIINAAKMRTTGFEIVLGYKNVVNRDLNFNINVNFAQSNNEVLELTETTTTLFSNADFRTGFNMSQTEVGRSPADFYGYVVEGIYQDYDEIAEHLDEDSDGVDPYTFDRSLTPNPSRYIAPGDFKFKDVDGDGVITETDKDYIGKPLPDFIYGGSINVNYRNFDLSVNLQGVYGNDIVNLNRYFLYGEVSSNKAVERLTDAWSEDNKDAKHPRIGKTRSNNMRFSNYYIEDGSYLRLKNLTLGYTLPVSISTRVKMSSLRIYFSAQNLLTFTNYSGYDPEIGADIGWNANPLDFGVDNGSYPQPKTFSIGLNANF